jgi:hypothetical protein
LASLNKSKEKALDSKALQEKYSLELAIALYVADNGSFPDTGGTSSICLTPTGCVLAGVNVPYSTPGALAFIEAEKENSFSLFKKANALIGNRIPSTLSKNPSAYSNNSEYRGPFYKCINRDNTKAICNEAVIMVSLKENNKSVGSYGSVNFNNGSFSVTKADGTGIGANISY